MTDNELEYYIRSFRKSVYYAVLCYVRNESDAEDITQNTFIKLYTYSGSFNDDEHVKAWLLRCAVNESKNLLRSHWYRFSAPLEAAGDLTYQDSSYGDDEGLVGGYELNRSGNRVIMKISAIYPYIREVAELDLVGVKSGTRSTFSVYQPKGSHSFGADANAEIPIPGTGATMRLSGIEAAPSGVCLLFAGEAKYRGLSNLFDISVTLSDGTEVKTAQGAADPQDFYERQVSEDEFFVRFTTEPYDPRNIASISLNGMEIYHADNRTE